MAGSIRCQEEHKLGYIFGSSRFSPPAPIFPFTYSKQEWFHCICRGYAFLLTPFLPYTRGGDDSHDHFLFNQATKHQNTVSPKIASAKPGTAPTKKPKAAIGPQEQ